MKRRGADSPSCLYSASPNADVVRKLFDACRSEGLGISAYFSKLDFHHDDYREGMGIGRATSRYPTYSPRENQGKWIRFVEFTKNQILELVRDYGPIDALWLDGAMLKPGSEYDLAFALSILRQFCYNTCR